MSTMILWSISMGLIAALAPKMATNVAAGVTAYLAAIPESIWALFGTGYLCYTAARNWGKMQKFDRQQGSYPRWNGQTLTYGQGDCI
jgi:hypothetical protein